MSETKNYTVDDLNVEDVEMAVSYISAATLILSEGEKQYDPMEDTFLILNGVEEATDLLNDLNKLSETSNVTKGIIKTLKSSIE